MLKINLGCGEDYKEGYVNIDISKLVRADLYLDLEKEKLPYGDSTVDEFRAWHFLEHVKDLSPIMEEIWRVGKHNAKIHIQTPYAFSHWNLSNIHHHQMITEYTFKFWENWRLAGKREDKAHFMIEDISYNYFPPYNTFSEEEQKEARMKYLNVVDSITQIITVYKV